MKLLDFFRKPKGDDHLFHDAQRRRESYDNRVSNATQLLFALGAALAMIGTETFGRIVENTWDRMVPVLFLGAVGTALVLGSSLVRFRYEARKLAHGQSQFNAHEWPATAESLYHFGLWFCRMLAALLIASLIWAAVSPASEAACCDSNDGLGEVSRPCPPAPFACGCWVSCPQLPAVPCDRGTGRDHVPPEPHQPSK